jgi:hypothetical protein
MRTTLAGLIVVSSVAVANATYVIKLKNGNEYVTNRYWQEDSQVLFDAEGGIFGVEKSFVAGIEKTEKLLRLVSVPRQDPSENKETGGIKETASKETASQESKKRERDPDDPVVAEFNRLKQQAEAIDSMLTSEIKALFSEIIAYKKKLSDRAFFKDYAKEFNDIHQISSVVEDALRERGR